MIAQVDDLDRIMSVMAAAFDPGFGEAWNRRQVEDALVLGKCHYGLAQADGECAGFYLSRFALDEEELLLLGVIPQQRGRGYGALLLETFMAEALARGARRVLLEMRQGNPAERLYSRYGFKQIGTRPNYYRGTNGQQIDAQTFAFELHGD